MKRMIILGLFLIVHYASLSNESEIYTKVLNDLHSIIKTDSILLVNQTVHQSFYRYNRADSIYALKLDDEFHFNYFMSIEKRHTFEQEQLRTNFNLLWVDFSYYKSWLDDTVSKHHELWEYIYSKYPQIILVTMSNIYYNRNCTKAAVYLTNSFWGYGSGYYVILLKKKNGWRIFKKIHVYKS